MYVDTEIEISVVGTSLSVVTVYGTLWTVVYGMVWLIVYGTLSMTVYG